jgi:hypothetical protein
MKYKKLTWIQDVLQVLACLKKKEERARIREKISGFTK